MSYKEITRESYEATAEAFAVKVAQLAPINSIKKFVGLLPPKANIIDIGCGSGRDAKIFTDFGLEVIGIDFSASMLQYAQKHAPLAKFQVMDIESLSFPAASFDGAWAGCVFNHISKKKIPAVLSKLNLILKSNGYFYITVKKGVGEVLEKDTRYGDFEKFWTYFEEGELKKMIEESGFAILELSTVEKQFSYQTHDVLRAFCQKIDKPL